MTARRRRHARLARAGEALAADAVAEPGRLRRDHAPARRASRTGRRCWSSPSGSAATRDGRAEHSYAVAGGTARRPAAGAATRCTRPARAAPRTGSCSTSSGTVADVRVPPRRARGAPALRGPPGGADRPGRPAARGPPIRTQADDAEFLDDLAGTAGRPTCSRARTRTREVLDTFRVMSWLQQRWGERCCGRYVVSFSPVAGAPGGRARPGPAGRGRSPSAPGRRPPASRPAPTCAAAPCLRWTRGWPCAAPSSGWPTGRARGGHARLLGLRQGRRPGQRHPEPRPRPGRPGAVGGTPTTSS